MQVNAQLIQARDDVHIWSETYRRELTMDNLFAVQSELAEKISRSLEAEISSTEQQQIERKPTENLEAYRLYVQGRSLMDERSKTGMKQAINFFRRAIDRDSTYALAWSGLADAWSLLASYGFGAADTLYPKARIAARRALEIDPKLGEPHASMGFIYMIVDRNGPAALREFQRAVDLNPSYARAYHWLGLHLLTLGQLNKGLEKLKRAVELNPLSAPIHGALFGTYHYKGKYDKALEQARRTVELAPDFPIGHLALGRIFISKNRPSEAVDYLQKGLKLADPGSDIFFSIRTVLAIAHHRSGNTTRTRELLAEIKEHGFSFYRAMVHAELEEWEAAIEALQQANYHHPQTREIRYEEVFNPLRDDPRFQKVIRRMNQKWGLNPDGSIPEDYDTPNDL